MRALILRKNLGGVIEKITKTFDELNCKYKLVQDFIQKDLEESDLLVIVGGDKDVLQTFHKIGKSKIPVIGVNDSNESSFLTEVNINDFNETFKKISTGEYWIEEATRLNVKVDSKDGPPTLNEVALFSSKSATLLEYVLSLDNDIIWRDNSDGVIISTPTGSTAYSMSAGGPMILHNAEVFTIVSVNSLDITRRPLIVSDKSTIKISEISSIHRCEVIIDGTYRIRAKEKIEVSRFQEPARFLRPCDRSKTMDKIAKKIKLAEELFKMPPSAKLILKTLEYEGALTQKEIVKRTLLPDRTTRLALSLLIEKGLIRRKSILRDTRQKVYSIT